MFKGIGIPRRPIAPTDARGTVDPPARTTQGRLHETVNLASRGGPPDSSIRPRAMPPVPARESSSIASPTVPDLAASRLHNTIREQAAEVHQLRTSLASLDQSLAGLPSLDGPGAFTAAWKQQQFQTERAEVAQKLAAAEPKLAQARARLTISTDSPPAKAMTPLPRQDSTAGMQQRTRGPTLGNLFAQEDQHQRQALFRPALPGGGAVMQRLKERAGRQHPTTNAEQWRARLKGPPQPMEGKRKEAFEALVRTDVLAVAKTGRMEPRLAARAMHTAVREGSLGQGILPQDRQLLLDTLDRMAKGGTPPRPPVQPAGVQDSRIAAPP